MWATLALGGLVIPAQVAGFTQDLVVALIQARVVALTQARVVALIQDLVVALIQARVVALIQARVVALMQDQGGLATQALVVKTLTLGIDPTQTVGRGVVVSFETICK